MRNTHLEPAASIIQLLGGLSAAAGALSSNTTTVQRWRLPKEKGGTGGYIPRWWHDKILAAAEAKGVSLPAAAFFDITALNSADTAA